MTFVICSFAICAMRPPFEGGSAKGIPLGGDDFQKSSPFVWIPAFFDCATLSKEGQYDNALNPDTKTSMVAESKGRYFSFYPIERVFD